MTVNQPVRHAVRRALAIGAIAALGAGSLAAHAAQSDSAQTPATKTAAAKATKTKGASAKVPILLAQTTPPPPSSATATLAPPVLQTVIVTGTMIQRPAAETAEAVTVISSTALKDMGVVNVEQSVDQITANMPSTVNIAQSVSTFTGGGTFANLRGLGLGRTLVLLDGQRLADDVVGEPTGSWVRLGPSGARYNPRLVNVASEAAMSLKDWIQKGRELGASDLHLESGTPLVVRIRGDLAAVGEAIPAQRISEVGRELLGGEAWARFLERGSADVSLAAGGMRCRLSLFRTIRGIAIAVRLLAPSVSDLRACNLHPDLRKLLEAETGLVVISGPTGSGKSTTLAALIEEINTSRPRNIITLESPLEYIFTNRRSFIRQREIPTHSPTFEQAVIDALRENPDVLVMSEMRTPEVIRLTLNAAETGHLVLATMHSASCAEALSRICMSFPAEIQGSIRAQLADALVGVVCQRLDFLPAHRLRVPRCELLLANTGIRGTLRTGQFSHIPNVMLAGGEEGMWTFDRYQRWMEQKTDWIRPAAVRTPAADEIVKVVSVPEAAPPPSAAQRVPAEQQPELTINEEMDLSEIAELARKIEERTR